MTDCAPLNAIEKMTAAYPTVWRNVEILYESRGSLPEWNTNLCYINISGAIAALSNAGKPEIKDFGYAALCAALATWRRNKVIYRFGYEIATTLMLTAEDIKIPVGIFNSLPAPCVYVQFPAAGKSKKTTIDGFLAFIEDDISRKKELRILYLNKCGELVLQYAIHLIPGGTIYDGIEEANTTIRKNAMRLSNSEICDKIDSVISLVNETRKQICQAVQLILYICAENADIIEDEGQMKIFRQTNNIIDKYREIRKYNVGTKTSAVLRKIAREGKSKKPHIRRNHWHHYWVGPRSDQHLILRWLPPIPVNMWKKP